MTDKDVTRLLGSDFIPIIGMISYLRRLHDDEYKQSISDPISKERQERIMQGNENRRYALMLYHTPITAAALFLGLEHLL